MQRPVIGPRQRDKIAAPFLHKLHNQQKILEWNLLHFPKNPEWQVVNLRYQAPNMT